MINKPQGKQKEDCFKGKRESSNPKSVESIRVHQISSVDLTDLKGTAVKNKSVEEYVKMLGMLEVADSRLIGVNHNIPKTISVAEAFKRICGLEGKVIRQTTEIALTKEGQPVIIIDLHLG